jgi:lon-related putative ATP-dependent protease
MAAEKRKEALSMTVLRRRVGADLVQELLSSKCPKLQGFIGRQRAKDALALGTRITQDGFNIFALGTAGSGRHEIILQFLKSIAEQSPAPPDLCYVHNFVDTKRPRAISLPAGMGPSFAETMDDFVDELKATIPAIFESREFKESSETLEDEYKKRETQTFTELAKRAETNGIAILNTPTGFVSAPARNGEVLSPEDFAKLSPEDQSKRNEQLQVASKELKTFFESVSAWRKEHREKQKAMLKDFAQAATGFLIQLVRGKYAQLESIQSFLSEVQKDVVEHIQDIPQPQGDARAQREDPSPPTFSRYKVNVFSSRDPKLGAPVIYEDNPTFVNLIGKMEQHAIMGALLTDFSLLHAGALHKANGGFLVVDGQRILTQPYAWETLKRCLLSKTVTIESLDHHFGTLSTVVLEPEPVALNIKVIVVGDRNLYYLLSADDPDFNKLFNIAADFDDVITRDEKADVLYVHHLLETISNHNLAPFSCEALAAVMEESMRLAGDVEKLSLAQRAIENILIEANYYAKEDNAEKVEPRHVTHAVKQARVRQNRLRDIVYEQMEHGHIQISVDGLREGQVNALSVIEHGGYAFGHAVRVTARARFGKAGIVDIQRETKLGGAIHAKGVYILSAYLQGTYAVNEPLTLSASLVFEQTYGLVEGDSASMAELCAILSALAEVPINQSFAVTGSVNQMGEIQAIGGVNDKIEGFFDTCKRLGFTSEQAVIIPHSNIRNLMLREDVVAACADGSFRIYAVRTVDEALELLTGKKARRRNRQGKFEARSLNDRVEKRLLKYARKAKSMASG